MTLPNISIASPEYAGFEELEPLTPLLRHLMPIVPELPHSMALDMLRQKYTDFARRTRILQTELPIQYQAGVRDYQLEAPDGYCIHMIMGVEEPRSPNPWYWYGEGYGHFRQQLAYDIIDNNIIRLRHTPSTDRPCGIRVLVVLLPLPSVSMAPTSILVPYGLPLARGVTADALLIPNKPWTNGELARVYAQQYERAVLNGRALAGSNRKVQSQDMKPVRIV